jgi:ABC-type multidrug transport system ATPase subunit
MFLAGTPAVELQAVVATIDGFPVLAGVDVRIEPGEVVLVSGPNGAGKTSLLRVLAGSLPVAAGSARVLGHDLRADRHGHRSRVAFVSQQTCCYDDLSVRRNLRLHAAAANAPAQAVAAAMRTLRLDDVAEVAHGRLSTGYRRRCALAVGMTRHADLLLLDEPHAGLDPEARMLVDDVVGEARDRGATVVLVSHELDHARPLVDREVVVAGGCVTAHI